VQDEQHVFAHRVLGSLHVCRVRTQSCSGLPMAARVAFAGSDAGSEEALKLAASATRDSCRLGPGKASCSGASSPAQTRSSLGMTARLRLYHPSLTNCSTSGYAAGTTQHH